MVAKGTKRQGNYPVAKYRYKPGDTKHPQEQVTCELCGTVAWVKKGSRFCSKSCAQSGSNNSVWRGEGAGYLALHGRVYRKRGPAREFVCACGKQAREWANLTGHYDDTQDYTAMCSKCHHRYDAARRADKLR